MTQKILVVEDDEKILAALKVRLQHHGYTVLTALDATQGLRGAVQESPDLVILDICMPAGGGLWVAESLRRLRKTAQIPMIFITASRAPDVLEQARKFRPVAYFQKPYDGMQLIATIE